MRLNSIKLSGFKSFVEPTHFQLPGQLVGVVGPNGCGKSNIIDAVRWVLGESKASELRGESMQDVIFNGSSLRKPAGRASVELVFDNDDGRAGGPWNRFAEIAVKRVLTRDGTSSYSHQRPAGAPARRPGRVPRHRPRPARLRDHRPGHDLADHREQARGAAPVPRGGGRRLEVQGAPARDRDAPEGHAREPDPRRGHPARAERATSTSSRRRPRSPAATARCSSDAQTEAAPALVPASTATRRARRSASRPGGRRRGRPRSNRGPPSCAAPRPSSRRSASRTTTANDALHAAQGALGRGRARGQPARGAHPLRRRRPRAARPQQRAELEAQSAQLARAREPRPRAEHDAHRRRRSTVGRARAPRRSPRELDDARRARSPSSKRRCATRRRAATRSAARSPRVQQQIQVLAAEARGVDEQLTPGRGAARAPRSARRSSLAAIEPGAARGGAARSAPTPRRSTRRRSTRASPSWQARVPALDEARRAAAGPRQRRGAPPRRARARASPRCRRCRRRCRSRTS